MYVNAKGAKLLKLAGILEIILGAASIGFTLWVMSQDLSKFNLVLMGAKFSAESFMGIAIVYGISIIQIVAGVIGVAFANRPEKAKLHIALAAILVVLAIITIKDISTAGLLDAVIPIIIPCIYMQGAVLNERK